MPSRERVNVVVYILVILFGVASWVDINGLMVELPILVQILPEGWSLPSYLVVLTQAANIGPLLYFLVKMMCSTHRSEKTVIFVIIVTNVITCLLIIFLWQHTAVIAGTSRSIAIFSLYFVLALVDCSSSLVFYPFMGNYKPAYMTAYFIGEGFSGLLPGVLSLGQGAGRIICHNTSVNQHHLNNETSSDVFVTKASYGDNLFSFEVFFTIICIIIVISGFSFATLVFHPRCQKEQVVAGGETAKGGLPEEESLTKQPATDTTQDINMAADKEEDRHGSDPNVTEEKEPKKSIGGIRAKVIWYIPIVLLTAWVNCLRNSVLLSVQSYSCLPYGTTQYHLAVTLSNVANTLACFVNLFIDVTSVPVLSTFTLVGSLLGAYIMAAAVMSPTPVLVGTISGSILIVTVWVVCSFLLSYIKVCLATVFRTEGKRGLLYLGAATQVGSAVGGVVMFIIVNILHIFVSVDPCSPS